MYFSNTLVQIYKHIKHFFNAATLILHIDCNFFDSIIAQVEVVSWLNLQLFQNKFYTTMASVYEYQFYNTEMSLISPRNNHNMRKIKWYTTKVKD